MPPLVGVAVNVTDAPTQIVVADAITLADAGTDAVNVIVIALDIAVIGEEQAAFEVMITVTTSPFANVLVVYIAEFVPTFPPFTCH